MQNLISDYSIELLKLILSNRAESNMGATCGSLNCNTKKHSKYPRANINRRPNPANLSQEEENEEDDERIAAPPDH